MQRDTYGVARIAVVLLNGKLIDTCVDEDVAIKWSVKVAKKLLNEVGEQYYGQFVKEIERNEVIRNGE
jgi:hypothetical protein